MGHLETKALKGIFTFDPVVDNPPSKLFPNKKSDPSKPKQLADLANKMKSGNHDFGAGFDGDADRVGVLDETGKYSPMASITALIAQDILATKKGVVFYDLRSSKTVPEVIAECGGTPMMSRVGHSFIKAQMRENNALFAGELSGHYYFRCTNYTAESAALAVLSVANIIARSGKPLSKLVKPLRNRGRFASGEISEHVTRDPKKILAEIKALHTNAGANVFELDGLSVEYTDWWFNVRCSNTEPLVRLNLEANDKALMETKRDELLQIILGSGKSGI
jgi:phosphomannomutase